MPPGHGRIDPWQQELSQTYQIEAPVMHADGLRLLRVSCHLYTTQEHLDRLVTAMTAILARNPRP